LAASLSKKVAIPQDHVAVRVKNDPVSSAFSCRNVIRRIYWSTCLPNGMDTNVRNVPYRRRVMPILH
jgi:hypothetical protein